MGFKYARQTVSLAMMSGDAWSVYSWITSNGGIDRFQIGPPEYFALIVFFTGMLVVINVSWLRSRFPSEKERFYKLHAEIEELIIAHDALEHGKMTNHMLSKYRKINRELDLLKIEYPNPPVNDPRPYWEWMTRLYGFSATKDIKGARNDKRVWQRFMERPDLLLNQEEL